MLLTSILAILPGMPIIVAYGGTLSNTTAFAPIIAPSPILIGPITTAPAPINTLSPIIGALPSQIPSVHLLPIVTF